MIDEPKPEPDQVKQFLYPPSGERWHVDKVWGTPLIVKSGDSLRFYFDDEKDVALDIYDRDSTVRFSSKMRFAADMLFTSKDNVDLVFRIDERGELLFDQDLDDNGAPRNGGGTGMGVGT